jgi:hypothetical protein
MFCSKCGKEIGEDSNFCYSCGSKLLENKLQKDSPTSFVDIAKDQSPGTSQEKIFNQESREMGFPGYVPSFTSNLPPLKHGGRRMIRKNHYGSTIGIVIGVILLLSYCTGVGKGMPPNVSTFVCGLVIVVGSLTYRSAKKRKLKEVENTKQTLAAEIIALLLVIAFVGLQQNILDKIEKEPVSYFIVPFWVIIAYLIISVPSDPHWKS